MPADLLHRQLVMLEQVRDGRPLVQEPPDPGQADEADPDLDAAGPVNPRQEGVLPPPGAKLVGYPLRIRLVVCEEPGGSQQREVLQPGDLPDLLDVAGLLLRAVVDAEGVAVRRRPAAGHRVEEPVGRHEVGPGYAEDLPLTPQQLVRGRKGGLLGLLGHAGGGLRRENGGEPATGRVRGRGRRSLPASYPPARPGDLACLVTGAPGHLGGRHPRYPARVPADPLCEVRTHTRSGRPLARLSRIAIVAPVVATRDSKE